MFDPIIQRNAPSTPVKGLSPNAATGAKPAYPDTSTLSIDSMDARDRKPSKKSRIRSQTISKPSVEKKQLGKLPYKKTPRRTEKLEPPRLTPRRPNPLPATGEGGEARKGLNSQEIFSELPGHATIDANHTARPPKRMKREADPRRAGAEAAYKKNLDKAKKEREARGIKQ